MADNARHEHRMSDTDALMWALEKDPALRSTITAIFIFDRTIDRDVLTHRFERLTRVVPKLRQRVRSNPLSMAPPRWETDPYFDLAFHLWWVNAPGVGSMRDLLSVAEPIAMSGFDRARPLWRVVVVEGLPGGRSALILKVHHAITDGIGAIQLQLELLDLTADAAEREMPPLPHIHVMTQPERFADAVDHQTRQQVSMFTKLANQALDGLQAVVNDPFTAAKQASDLAGSVSRVVRPTAHAMSPIMDERSLSVRFDTLTINRLALHAAAKAAGGTLNDAYVGGIARGLYHYHLRHDVDCDELRMAIPISLRHDDSDALGGNAFIPARLEVPIDIADPVELMQAIHRLVDDARHEPANDLVDPLSGVINRFPTAAITAVFAAASRAVDFAASNVPGAPFPMYLGGAELLAQFPFGPLTGSAMNLTLLSYQDDLNIGVVTDPAAVPDGPALMDALTTGFEEILELAPPPSVP